MKAARAGRFATLPIRPFSSGHGWFNQGVQKLAGHELPQHVPVNVHFTFQFGDTPKYPHGKRQRAREAALWAVDPPSYFTEGVYIALSGPAFTTDEEAAVYRRFPEWSPQRHMFMDAPQRRAVRDLLGLASTFDGVAILPKFYCYCDRCAAAGRNPFSCLRLQTRWAAGAGTGTFSATAASRSYLI